MKRFACPYDPNRPGNRYQELMRQLAIHRERNEQLLAMLETLRDDLAELKEMGKRVEAKLGELKKER